MFDTDDILKQRGERYGEYATHSKAKEAMGEQLAKLPNWDNAEPIHRQAANMIIDKLARVFNGDFMYEDNWQDIEGYAKLVRNHIDRSSETGTDKSGENCDMRETDMFSLDGNALNDLHEDKPIVSYDKVRCFQCRYSGMDCVDCINCNNYERVSKCDYYTSFRYGSSEGCCGTCDYWHDKDCLFRQCPHAVVFQKRVKANQKKREHCEHYEGLRIDEDGNIITGCANCAFSNKKFKVNVYDIHGTKVVAGIEFGFIPKMFERVEIHEIIKSEFRDILDGGGYWEYV